MPCYRFCFKGTIPDNEVFPLAIEISIIAQVIIKMHVLWLVKNCIIFCNSHLAQGNYSRGARSRNGCFGLWHNMQEAINVVEENTILKSKITLQSLAQQLSKEKHEAFATWIGKNLWNSGGNWLLISTRIIKTIVTKWFQQQNKFTAEFESTWVIILKQLFAFRRVFAFYLLLVFYIFRNYAHWLFKNIVNLTNRFCIALYLFNKR